MGTGINLIDQLGEKSSQNSEVFTEEEEASGGLFSFLKRKKNVEQEIPVSSSEMDARDRAQVILFIIGMALVFGPKFYLEQELAKKTEIKSKAVADLTLELNQEKKKEERLKVIREEMLKFDGQVAELKRKIQKVEDLSLNKNYLVRTVDFLTLEMPNDIWLVKLSASRGGAGEISLEGYAMNLQKVSEFMSRLETAVFYPNWILEETTNEGTKAEETRPGDIVIPADAKKFKIKAKVVEPQV
jgi:Tfp pilus assembly protein PilN